MGFWQTFFLVWALGLFPFYFFISWACERVGVWEKLVFPVPIEIFKPFALAVMTILWPPLLVYWLPYWIWNRIRRSRE